MTEREQHKLHLFLAQKVMGWKMREGYSKRFIAGQFQNEGDYIKVCLDDGTDDPPITVWAPTTDYAQALQVLERCLQCPHTSDSAASFLNGNYWLRANILKEKNWQHAEGQAPTLPEAICLFAEQLYR